jgi:hypothetical protein
MKKNPDILNYLLAEKFKARHPAVLAVAVLGWLLSMVLVIQLCLTAPEKYELVQPNGLSFEHYFLPKLSKTISFGVYLNFAVLTVALLEVDRNSRLFGGFAASLNAFWFLLGKALIITVISFILFLLLGITALLAIHTIKLPVEISFRAEHVLYPAAIFVLTLQCAIAAIWFLFKIKLSIWQMALLFLFLFIVGLLSPGFYPFGALIHVSIPETAGELTQQFRFALLGLAVFLLLTRFLLRKISLNPR